MLKSDLMVKSVFNTAQRKIADKSTTVDEIKSLSILVAFVFMYFILVPSAWSQEKSKDKKERKSEEKKESKLDEKKGNKMGLGMKEWEREEREREEEEKERDGAQQSLERDLYMMKDPALGYVPKERLMIAKNYKDQLMQNNFALSNVTWQEQGPDNQGGRTRALMVDPNDGSGNTIWAGSVGGGLWKTTDINSSSPDWQPVNDLLSNLAVISIAYDPSNTMVMYFCTGEGYNNSDAIKGDGVFKSTDGGITWTQLASTASATFDYCQKIVVNSTGTVFVSTATGGLQRSTNGGTTWTKVLGTGLGITGATSNFCYDVEIAANGDIYSSLNGSIHKSVNGGVTFAAAQTLPITAGRIELACAPSDANYVFGLVEDGNVVAGIIRTVNAGSTWTSRTEPTDADPGCPVADFSNGQAWYDLSIAVDPLNRDRLFVGGLDIFGSTDGAGTWTQITHWYGGFGFQYAHADQHNIVFKSGSSSIAYFSNDGGVYRTGNANATTPTLDDKNLNYRTAQFYACAMSPTAQTSYYLAGAQDNGTKQFTSIGIQSAIEVTGGDGAFCHIDQDQPQFQWTQYIFNDFYRSSDGGASWTNITSSGGMFISPTDYDDVNNRMYICKDNNNYLRWDNPQSGAIFTTVAVAGFGGQVSAIKVSPNTANRVFFGIDNGDVFRLDNAHTGTPTATNISTGLPAGYVSCVEVETGNDSHILVTYSNYGLNSVWESTNAGASWTSVEGNLPDMPIRWALFSPNNNDQVVLATELGVWSTDNLNGGATTWGATNSGLANVRVDMLQIRQSDKYVIAATHGRGLFASDLFTSPTSIFSSDIQLTYINSPVQFTSNSYKATSWSWDFGDGSSLSTSENPSHTYTTAGKYNVTLTINGGAATLTKTQYIQVLPNRGTPYVVATDGGTFETNPDDFGSQSIRGGINKWERGVPSNFLVTVNSPTNVWKTDLDADLTSGDYACVLQTPSFNFTSSASAYTLRFRRSMEIVGCNGPFAVQLQYSIDKGLNWTRLGINADPAATNWYNRGPATGCPIDAAVFPDQYGWTSTSNNILCTYNITTGVPALVGQSDVTFRFVLSVEPGFSPSAYAADGFMIDDFEILGPVNFAVGSPSIVTTGSLTPFSACSGTASTQQSFTVSGSGLSANLVVTPPTGFEVSTTSGSGFASSVSLTPSSGTVSTTTIFVRMSSSASGTPSGNIACTSTGVTTQNVAANGTVNVLPTAAISPTSGILTCSTTSIGLTASGGGTYQWNAQGGNATTAGISATTAGTYSVTVTLNGCTAGASTVITSDTTPPNATISATPDPVCMNTVLNLSVADAGIGSTYSWTGLGVINANSNSTTATPTSSGTQSYGVTVTANNGCSASSSINVTVENTSTWFQDLDTDTYGNIAVSQTACVQPVSFVSNNLDCNDADASINPGAAEIANGIDDNCNGLNDEVCQIISAQCNATLPFMTKSIVADNVIGATSYRFRVIHNTDTNFVTTTNRFFFITSIPNYQYNTVYHISVAVQMNNGPFGDYGSSCDVSTPLFVTKVRTSQCGQTLSGLSSVIADILPGAVEYKFRIVYNGYTQIIITNSYFFSLASLDSAGYNRIYSIDVAARFNGDINFGNFGAVCLVNSGLAPLTQVQNSQCNTTIPAPNTNITANGVLNATQYRFRVSQGLNVQEIVRPTRVFNMTMFTGWTFGTTYNVEVASFLTGAWTAFGSMCTISTPAAGAAVTQLDAASCGATVTLAQSALATNVIGATQYQFHVVNTLLGYDQTIIRPSRTFRFSFLPVSPALVPGTTYQVSVRAMTGGSFPPFFGPVCNLTLAVTPEQNVFQVNSSNHLLLDVTAIPNPFSQTFTLKINSESIDPIYVRVYDMNGKMLEVRNIQASEAKNIAMGENLAAGMYQVTVTQGDMVKTLKVIKTLK